MFQSIVPYRPSKAKKGRAQGISDTNYNQYYQTFSFYISEEMSFSVILDTSNKNHYHCHGDLSTLAWCCCFTLVPQVWSNGAGQNCLCYSLGTALIRQSRQFSFFWPRSQQLQTGHTLMILSSSDSPGKCRQWSRHGGKSKLYTTCLGGCHLHACHTCKTLQQPPIIRFLGTSSSNGLIFYMW